MNNKFADAVLEELTRVEYGFSRSLVQRCAEGALEKLAKDMVDQVIQEHRKEIDDIMIALVREQIEFLKQDKAFLRQSVANGVWNALRRDEDD